MHVCVDDLPERTFLAWLRQQRSAAQDPKDAWTDKFDLYLQKYDINFETENDALLARSVHALPVETDELTRTAVTRNGAGRSM